ncbi:MAG: BTAD domain-containing putative transcriptional regulator [Ktedonobacterales bacterium]
MRQTRSGNLDFPDWKFEAPRLDTCLLARERLLRAVEQCLGGSKNSSDILLVSAPAGYGKSTLLAQWALRTSLPVVWYHMDPSDQDPSTLLRGIARTLHRKFPRPRWNVESLLNNLRTDLLGEFDLARACRVLSDDIDQHVGRSAALILTNVAELGGAPAALAALDQLLSRPTGHLRLALEWREAPQLRFSSLIAQQRIRAIGRDELSFTRDELDALLNLAGAPNDDVYRDQVRRLSAGWVAGAMLAIGAQSPLASLAVEAGELDHEAVTDYLAHQVIAVLPPELSTFATQAAILNYMTASLCARMFGLPNSVAREQLGALERSTGFVSRSGQRPQTLVYRFQPQLRQALLSRLDSLVDGSEQRLGLHRLAASLLEEEQDYVEAIWHHTETGNFARIADLIEDLRDEYLRASRGLLLSRWLDLLPPTVLESRPHLQLLQAELYRQSGRGIEALAMAQTMYQRLKPVVQPQTVLPLPSEPVSCRMAARAAIICAEVQLALGSYNSSQQSAHDALALLDCSRKSGDETAGLETLYARAYECLSATVMLTDGPVAAERYLRACEQYSLFSGDLWQVGRHHYYRSKVYMREGKFGLAESAATAALLAAQEAHDEICAVVSRLNLGAIKMRLGRSVEAREELETALVAAEAAGYTIGRVYALGNLGDLALSCGDYTQAIQLYEQTLESLGYVADIHLRMCVLAGLGYALTLSRRAEEALIRLTPVLESGPHTEAHNTVVVTADDVVVALSLGFAYLHHGLASHALNLLLQAADAALRQHNYLKAAQAYLFLAAVRLAEADEGSAEKELFQALDHALQVQDALALAVELRRVPEVWPLLERLDHPLATGLLRASQGGRLDSLASSRSNESSVHDATAREFTTGDGQISRAIAGIVIPSQLDPSIRVYMFGEARVLVGTTYVTRWRKPAARDLLLFLLHSRKPVSREAILTALWPDSDPDVSDVWFRQARFHLKRTLQRDDCLVQEESGYWRLNLACWVDVYEAERQADEGMRLLAANARSAGADCVRQALTLWNGSYLDDLYVDWPAARRQELYQRRLALLEQLASLELEAGSPDGAIQLYQQILATEPLLERAHRGLMSCFVARGEPSRAIQQFRDFSAQLRQEMDTVPARETIGLCQSILQEMETSKRAFAQVVSHASAFL